MTDTPDITAKKADGQDISDDLTALAAKIDAMKDQPHWFAGLPEPLVQLRNIVDHHGRAIRTAFSLSVPE